MNQLTIGEALRTLRKEKGLTQEQLAERFNTTNRSISRWENGNNLPDISILIDLAEFYDVELKDILSGNILKENMETNVKETAILVADYTNAAKERMRKVMHFLFILSAIGLLVSFLLEEIELNGHLADFFKGIGIGLSFGSLIVGAIMTSKYADQLYQFKQKRMDEAVTVPNGVLYALAVICYVMVVICLFAKAHMTIIITDFMIANLLMLAAYRNGKK